MWVSSPFWVISIAKAVEATKARAQSQAIFLTKAIFDYIKVLDRLNFEIFQFRILEAKLPVVIVLF